MEAATSDTHRLIINLHGVAGYTISEIIEIKEIFMGTLKFKRRWAREHVQKLLEKGPE
jgi:hypothetical protein